MTLALRLAICVICVIFLVVVILLVARGKLLLKYSLLWVILALVILLCAIFPQPLFALTNMMGFQTSSNLIIVIALFFILATMLSLSVISSKQANSIKRLTQELALIKEENEERLKR